MLSKLLLVLGLCLLAGVKFANLSVAATQIHSSLLSLGVGVVLLPAAYHFALKDNSDIAVQLQMTNILKMSRGVSIILLSLYGFYLFFQLYSHTHLYQDAKNRSETLHRKHSLEHFRTTSIPPPRNIYSASNYSETILPILVSGNRAEGGVPLSRDDTLVNTRSNDGFQETVEHPEALRRQEPQLSIILTLAILIIITMAVTYTADHLVEAMDSISTTIPKPYVALIILPTVSSIAECLTAINASAKDELNFALSVAVGSTIQTALFVIPWVMAKPLSLLIDPFESLVLYISVQVVASVVSDGKSNYLEGLVLFCTWCIISVSFWFYPAWNLNAESICKT
ncbi:Calcium/proton exchanger [Mycena indigotica]|uniref:Calcium/proton exchanger n=1 Tax=Mycena indigotica TaxID=2126181 RepID=A0A8H6TAD1_9AGAR|nr:Calcium/proton exchanger [Mycena indigotica]KAF7312250.1 Calcium/proton exchanger [Mycena indigotica]